MYFYPRSPCGERPTTDDQTTTNNDFYPRSPCGERRRRYKLGWFQCHFYPRSPCGERPRRVLKCDNRAIISIHALLAESDHDTYVIMEATKVISIHALLAESDLFLRSGPMTRRYFYPRSPCGERQGNQLTVADVYKISIHALLAESDRLLPVSLTRLLDFYPRSPCGERPVHFMRSWRTTIFLSTLSLRRATAILSPMSY